MDNAAGFVVFYIFEIYMATTREQRVCNVIGRCRARFCFTARLDRVLRIADLVEVAGLFDGSTMLTAGNAQGRQAPPCDFFIKERRLMRRVTVNFIVNLMSFVVLPGLSASGIIIALPHEHGPNEAKGPLVIGRGEWGDIHLWLGTVLVALMLVHLVLHWDWVECYVKSVFCPRRVGGRGSRLKPNAGLLLPGENKSGLILEV
jgi:hypothetical protein